MKIVFATNNPNKIIEIQSMLPESITIVNLKSIGCHEEIPETAATIEENAIMKANYITEKYGYDCFADDTGLEVEALKGEPGVFSARYAGEQRSADDNMNKLLLNLENTSNRKAHFKTVITLNLKTGSPELESLIICSSVVRKIASCTQGANYDLEMGFCY